jgi:hypothetical protein
MSEKGKNASGRYSIENYVEFDTKLSNLAFLEDLAIISMQNEP